jgi:hypothetical protein
MHSAPRGLPPCSTMSGCLARILSSASPEALQLDRFHLGAVLLGLAAALRLLTDVELVFDAVGLAVEQVDERPPQIGEIVLEARTGQHGAEGLDHRVELAAHRGRFRQGGPSTFRRGTLNFRARSSARTGRWQRGPTATSGGGVVRNNDSNLIEPVAAA